jgi:hypothetical protein
MKRFRKYSLQIAAAAIVAVILTLAAPRAVHAVTAALVTVTNTASSPSIDQGIGQLASENVFLVGFAGRGASDFLRREPPDGSPPPLTPFAAPAGQSLVITSIEVMPNNTQGIYTLELLNGASGNSRNYFLRTPPAYTTQFQFPTGIVFPAGQSVQVRNESTSPDFVYVYMHGYLTSN